MAIELISKIKPKNGGSFPLVDAADVEMPDGKRLSEMFSQPSETEIFAQQEVSGFAVNAEFGAWVKTITPAPFALTVGETYTVIWGEERNECTAVPFDFGGTPMACIGNQALVGGENTGEKFGIAYAESIDYVYFFSLEEGESHTVAIYGTAQEAPELPSVSAADNGKFLRVVDGAWAAVAMQDVSEVGL